MPSEFNPTDQWDRVASELRACKQAQQQAWGDIDNTTLGRYLADELSADERRDLEQALADLPELRKLTDVVRDVLDEFDPAAPQPVSDSPRLLPFIPPVQKKHFWRQRGALVVAASLLLGLGVTLGGVKMFAPAKPDEGQFAFVPEATKPNGPDKASDTLPGAPSGERKIFPHMLFAKQSGQENRVEADHVVARTGSNSFRDAPQEVIQVVRRYNFDALMEPAASFSAKCGSESARQRQADRAFERPAAFGSGVGCIGARTRP
jgi:hypothetical protein